MERLQSINNDVLRYNLTADRFLVSDPQNDRQFDDCIGLPFTKGVTERSTGRTLLVLGSNAHIEAMQSLFKGVIWTSDAENKTAKYGNTIRWINVGNMSKGFIGIDFDPDAPSNAGVAKTAKDVSFLARTLMELGFSRNKQMYLLSPPFIVESLAGQFSREEGLETLYDYANHYVR